MARRDFNAVLLAAGRSARMGLDKAMLEVGGEPLWRHQRQLLVESGATDIFLSARLEQPWVRDAKWAALLVDDLPNAGPISGITAALERSTRGHVLVLAIDLPQMNARWLRDLVDECGPGSGVVGRHQDFFEPLAAIYPREMIPLFRAALAKAQYALQPVLTAAVATGLLRVREIAAEEADWFQNWNEPKEPEV